MYTHDAGRRWMLKVALVCLGAALVVLLWALAADARPSQCVVVLDVTTVEQAATELVRYAGVLQTEEITDVTMGHVVTLTELAQALADAPRLGCEITR